MFGLLLAQTNNTASKAEGVNNSFFQSIGNLFGAGKGSLANTTNIGNLIVAVLQILLLIGGSVSVIFLVVGGYQYVVSRGNEEAMEKAKKTISSSIIGLIVIVMSFVIIRIIAAILLQAPEDLGV